MCFLLEDFTLTAFSGELLTKHSDTWRAQLEQAKDIENVDTETLARLLLTAALLLCCHRLKLSIHASGKLVPALVRRLQPPAVRFVCCHTTVKELMQISTDCHNHLRAAQKCVVASMKGQGTSEQRAQVLRKLITAVIDECDRYS